VRGALTAAVVGIAGGVLLTAVLARSIASLLVGVSPGDPRTLIGVASALGAATALATWIPSRRAARTAPSEALRVE
jgi:ABC-type antimicrobial peptide transport system permease subunit